MRVLAITNLFPNPLEPRRAPFNLQQLRSLAEGHALRVIAPIAFTGEFASAARGELPRDRRVVRDGMVVEHPRYLFTPRVLRGWYGRFFEASIRATFDRAVAEHRPDVVLGCWAYPDGWAAVRLARGAGLPVAIKVHGSDLLTVRDGSVRFRRTAGALCAADAVIAVSDDLARRAAAMGVGADRLHVVRNGVDRALFAPGDQAEARRRLGLAIADPLVLFVGNLVEVKGPDRLIDAMALVARSHPNARCALVGAGPMAEAIVDRARLAGLGDRVRLHGSRPLDELPLWYRAADCLVLSSRSEGIPNVLLEATACGTPWIASGVGGVPELASAGTVVHPQSIPHLADAIAERLRIGPAGRMASEVDRVAPSWRRSAETLAAVLAGIVERSAHERRRVA